MINEDMLRENQGLSGLKHCMEVSEEQPKKRICGPYRRIPCRARSLSIQHNGESAYFEVPHDAPHGMQLNCSHEECINSGRRFRYCNGKYGLHESCLTFLFAMIKISHLCLSFFYNFSLRVASCQKKFRQATRTWPGKLSQGASRDC